MPLHYIHYNIPTESSMQIMSLAAEIGSWRTGKDVTDWQSLSFPPLLAGFTAGLLATLSSKMVKG